MNPAVLNLFFFSQILNKYDHQKILLAFFNNHKVGPLEKGLIS
jgi:hypothetical protein